MHYELERGIGHVLYALGVAETCVAVCVHDTSRNFRAWFALRMLNVEGASKLWREYPSPSDGACASFAGYGNMWTNHTTENSNLWLVGMAYPPPPARFPLSLAAVRFTLSCPHRTIISQYKVEEASSLSQRVQASEAGAELMTALQSHLRRMEEGQVVCPTCGLCTFSEDVLLACPDCATGL
jgi:hypothetical protein